MLFLGPDEAKTMQEQEFFGMDLFGSQDGQPQQFPGSAYWVSDDLFRIMLEAILKQLKRAGFRIVVAHGHTPSVELFNRFIEEWGKSYDLELFTCLRDDESDGFGLQTDHAAANETSLVMALRPELVQMDKLSQDPDEWPAGVSGKDPRRYASAEVGRASIEMQVKRMSDLLLNALSKGQV
jgi:creatinine amidohydrolase